MSEPWQPFPALNFVVEILPDGDSKPLAGAAFSDCDGLEVTQEVKTLKEAQASGSAAWTARCPRVP